jgi:hypothetical protein
MSAYLDNKVYPKSSEPVNLSNRAIQDLTEGRYLPISSQVEATFSTPRIVSSNRRSLNP